MFDKEKFGEIIKKINDTYPTQYDFANKSTVNRTYLSQYINKKLSAPPSPNILKKIVEGSKGITTYNELMQICGYGQTIEKTSIENGAIEYLKDMVKRQEPGWSLVEIALNYIKKLEGGNHMLDTQENSKNKNAAQHTKKEEF